MPKKIEPPMPEMPIPEKKPEVIPAVDPKEPLTPMEEPLTAPDENPYTPPPIEIPDTPQLLFKLPSSIT